jgi:hypothetical protein
LNQERIRRHYVGATMIIGQFHDLDWLPKLPMFRKCTRKAAVDAALAFYCCNRSRLSVHRPGTGSASMLILVP